MGVRSRLRGAPTRVHTRNGPSIFDDALRDAPPPPPSSAPTIDFAALAARAEPLPSQRRRSAAAQRRAEAESAAAAAAAAPPSVGYGHAAHGGGPGASGNGHAVVVDPAADATLERGDARGAQRWGGLRSAGAPEAKQMRPGAAVLFGFMKGVGGIRKSQLAGLRGDSVLVDSKSSWIYRLEQGREVNDLREIRTTMNPRLFRQGSRHVGPSWARLLLGDAYAEVPTKRQIHTLHYFVSACSCLKCLVENVVEDQSVPSVSSLLEAGDSQSLDFVPGANDVEPSVPGFDADSSDEPHAVSNLGSKAGMTSRQASRAAGTAVLQTLAEKDSLVRRQDRSALWRNERHAGIPYDDDGIEASVGKSRAFLGVGGAGGQRQSARDPDLDGKAHVRHEENTAKHLYAESFAADLPSFNEISLLGGAVQTTAQFEIGVVSKLSSRSGARLTLSDAMQQFAGHAAYTGPISMGEMYTSVLSFAKTYYKKNKGKRERKVLIRGELQALPIPHSVLPVGNASLNMHEPNAVVVIARAQTVNVFHGKLVLEGSFGSFIDMNIPWFLGFGESKGAQALLPDGTLSPARPLGINELCVHSDDFEREPKTFVLT